MMNYANMIEEKNLKKTFIIATLCSTIIGTFSSSIGLWDRVKQRRLQQRRDLKQDDEIKSLKDKIEAADRRSADALWRLQHSQPPPPQLRDRDRDEVGESLRRSGALIRREFDDGYERYGRRFAVGDAITENRLQAQIIALQQTVIDVLQAALYDGRQLTHADVARLVAASDAARDGSLDALRHQRQRLTATKTPLAQPPPPSSRRSFSLPANRRPVAALTAPEDELFCRYSLDLQHARNKPLASSFAPGGDCRCPACGVRLAAARPDDFWAITKRAVVKSYDDSTSGGGGSYDRHRQKQQELVEEEREFHLGQRFVVKCHTPDGEFACVLCNRHRDADVLCRSAEALVNHVGRRHDVAELEREVDLFERPHPPPQVERAALPPPVPMPPSPPPARREVDGLDLRGRDLGLPAKYR
ncbi:hypothetical protein DL762_002848 [Monosporascus cannonballus]|uniref:Uncharacterized protein n=1 Tax=Monosporascus cannonballus TaxID=155416 RepID=A0ABY0HDJ4_9PEZI|nr:hypothetical protein DL762_002848 [Monosporascus cannonballus]RYO95585.1 hypothetical protein DL763_003655 [Monosporascus cannonballus]